MSNQLQPVPVFVAVVALLVSAASAQTFARESTPSPDPPIGDALPVEAPTFTATEFADSPVPELAPETAVLGSLDTPTVDFDEYDYDYATEEEMDDAEEDLADVRPETAILGSLDTPTVDFDEYDYDYATEEEMDDEEEAIADVPPATVFRAIGLDGEILNGTSSQDVKGTAICGANSLRPTNIERVCKLSIYWKDGAIERCSGWIYGTRYIATAGHCLYRKQRDGYPREVKVYCNANAGRKGPLTTTSIPGGFAVPSKWRGGDTRNINAWDGGIFKTRTDLPYSPYRVGENIGNYNRNVQVAGYPGQGSNPNNPCRRYPQYNGLNQFASIGKMSGKLNPQGFFVYDTDTCPGQSGSRLYDPAEGLVTGIHVGGSCNGAVGRNVAVPLRVKGVDDGCNHPRGGVGLKCLKEKLRERG